MAIIRSLAVGKARKSAGNLTFRTVRGRTIASEKIGPRPVTRADGALTEAEFMFALISRFASLHASDINLSFDKTKYGTSRNSFMKLNYAGLKAALLPLFASNPDAAAHTDAAIEEAVTTYATANQTVIYRVKRSGFEVKYLVGAWTSDDNPVYVSPFEGTVTALKIGSTNIVNGSEDGAAISANTATAVTLTGTGLKDVSTVAVNINGTNLDVSITSVTDSQIVGTITSTSSFDGTGKNVYIVKVQGVEAFKATTDDTNYG